MSASRYVCKNCKGDLEYSPGVRSLVCQYCGTENEIEEKEPVAIQEELDFTSTLRAFKSDGVSEEVHIETCSACGAEITLKGSESSGNCAFCGTQIIVSTPVSKVMPPQYLAPFAVTREASRDIFKNWLANRWFAPNALKRMARVTDPLSGIYAPFWTFDSKTDTHYTGQRGERYQETYETKDSEGKTVTRQETKIRWTPVSGSIEKSFDDILVSAGRCLPPSLAVRLDKWNLSKIVDYNTKYIAGFKCEAYSIDPEQGLVQAKQKMKQALEQAICRKIGGDVQQVNAMNIKFSDITFKYILLPVWGMKYKFGEKYYDVLVNGQTGEIEGARPYSIAKIAAFVAAVAAGSGLIWYIYNLVQ